MKKFGKLGSVGALSLAAVLGIGSATLLAQTGGGGGDTGQQAGSEKRGGGRGERGGKSRKDRRGGGEGRMGGARMFGGLDLSDEQKARIKQIRDASREGTKALREQLRAKRQELRAAQTGDSFDEGLVTQKLTEMAAVEAKIMGENFKLRQEMMAVLTPEQKTKLEERRAEREKRRAGRRGGAGTQND